MRHKKSPTTVGPPPGRGLYCSRTLNLRSIKVIGYDMDYTLIQYHVEDWERRAYDHIKGRLIDRGWPLDNLQFDPTLVMRGLVIDNELGNLLKVNRFGFVVSAYHGTRPMDHEDLRKAYMRTLIDLGDKRYRFLNTLFALSEACMYAQVVDKLDAGKLPEEHTGYQELYMLVRNSVDATHTEGELKAEIIESPDSFVDRDPDTVLALLDQKRAGKQLVLITNSEWSYTNAMMRYAFDPFLPDEMAWRDLFDLTICGARKPGFFEGDAPLLEVVDDSGLLRPQRGGLTPNGCYFGGNAAALEKHLGVSGDEILYLGDHIYGDVHVSKSVLRWRTGLILHELEEEIAAAEAFRPEQLQLAELMHDKEQLEWRHYQLRIQMQRSRKGYGPKPTQSAAQLNKQMNELRTQSTKLDELIAPLAKRAGQSHNARWGLLMRAGADKSQLARKIERHADVYTSRVSNFLFATPFAYLRAQRGSLPHDPAPVSVRLAR